MSTVLVIDDDQDSRYAVALYLSKMGFSVRSACNGREGIAAILAGLPDAIVLDVQMPEMDGIEFLRVIRSYMRWTEVPVILLTAYPEGPHIDAAHNLGVRCIYAKAGFQMTDLVQSIRKLIDDPAAPGC